MRAFRHFSYEGATSSLLPFLLLISSFGIAAAIAKAGDEIDARTLDEGCEKLADIVARTLDEEGCQPAVIVGSFSGVARLQSSGGVGLAQRVREALRDRGVAISESDSCQLNGEFSTPRRQPLFDEADVPEPDQIALRIEYVVRDRNDETKRRGVINVFGNAPLAIGGATVSFAGKDGRISGRVDADRLGDQMDRLEAAIAKPVAFVVNAETRATPDGPFGVEIIADTKPGRTGAPRVPTLRAGRAFVRLGPGEEYVVRLHNRTDREIAVNLVIDGVDVFAFQDVRPDGRRMQHLVIEPRTVTDVKGWYVNEQKLDAFEIMGYSKSAAASLLKPVDEVGVITAIFLEADETRTKNFVTTKIEEPDATGRGREIAQDTEVVDRVIGRPLTAISVRYERP